MSVRLRMGLAIAIAACTLFCGFQAFVPATRGVSINIQRPEGAMLRGMTTDSAQAGSEAGCLGSMAFAAAVAGIGLAVAAGQVRRSSRVSMNYLRRGENYMRPNAKGTKPLINRSIAADDMKVAHEGWKKKYRNADDMEDIMKKTVYGRAQFQFSSNHFTDELPWFPVAGSSRAGNRGTEINHHYDNPFYVRKFISPAKFKKLELAAWEMPDNAPRVCTLDELVRAGMQYGHSAATWNPKMLPYLYSDFDGTHIFDLVQTSAQLNRACYYAMEAASKGAKFLFSGTKEQAAPFIKSSAEDTGSYYCDTRFAGGLLTNFKMVRASVDLMLKMKREQEQGAWNTLEEETALRNKMKANRLWRKYKGVADMTDLPDIMIVVDETKERNAVIEAARIGVPVIGLLDSNSNPDSVDLPIPGNASGSRSIELVMTKLTEAIKKGQAMYNAQAVGDREEIPREFDPWIFSKDRLRIFRRKTKRQAWHKTMYGSYENFKKANPYGYIPKMGEFEDIKWNFTVSEGMGNL